MRKSMTDVGQNQEGTMLDLKNMQSIFNELPYPALVLLPQPPEFKIVEMNKAYQRLSVGKEHASGEEHASDTRKTGPISKMRAFDRGDEASGSGFTGRESQWTDSGLFELLGRNEASSRCLNQIRNSLMNVMENKTADSTVLKQRECSTVKDRAKKTYLQYSHTPVVNSSGEIDFIIHSVTDVTEEEEKDPEETGSSLKEEKSVGRLMEEKEQLIRELTRQHNDLQQFSYITSHNLRSPLSNLMSLLYLIENIPIKNRELKKLFDDVRSSTQILNSTIEDLNKILIIKENPSVHRERIRFSEVLEKVLSQNKRLVDQHDVRISTDFQDAPEVKFSRIYLENIFLNLLTNSLRFRSSSRPCRINITSKIEGESIRLTFEDNGIGLDVRRNKDRIFGLYQKFHDHSESKGMGLYLVKSQLEALGGSVSIESEVGKGFVLKMRFKT